MPILIKKWCIFRVSFHFSIWQSMWLWICAGVCWGAVFSDSNLEFHIGVPCHLWIPCRWCLETTSIGGVLCVPCWGKTVRWRGVSCVPCRCFVFHLTICRCWLSVYFMLRYFVRRGDVGEGYRVEIMGHIIKTYTYRIERIWTAFLFFSLRHILLEKIFILPNIWLYCEIVV